MLHGFAAQADSTRRSSEDATGPVTTCNLSTMEPEPHLDLPFEDDDK